MRRLTLICHAATRSQRDGRFPPFDEPILTDSAGPGTVLPVCVFLCAPERRAQETALLFGHEPTTDQALRDCDFGAWRSQTLEEIHSDDPSAAEAWFSDPHARPHGGETLAELSQRMAAWLDGLAQNGHVLAITHAAVMRAAALHLLQAPSAAFWRLDVQPLSTMDFRFNGRFWTIRSLNAPVGP